MFQNESRVLLILPQDVLDRVRVLAGKATTTLKLPVSLQIVVRALIAEGLKRDGDRHLLANIEAQAQAVRRIRSLAPKGGRAAAAERGASPSGIPRVPSGRGPQRRGK
ncbi:MAG TPA: hypothetical protein VLT62_00215 [Candidatus Methylomirabilis sp.]|nr:hypothetical protein [Candidatus Methylomirabilis sp.]